MWRPSVARGSRHTRLVVVRLYARLVRRSAVLISVAMAGYLALEVASYRTAYPDGVDPAQFRMFEDNPAVRIMNGVPVALDTAGGFTVWDGGWLMQIIVGVWAILMTSRLLRGEEDLERSDLVLATPVRSSAVTGIVLMVMAASAGLVGVASTLALGMVGESWVGAVLFGLGLAGVAATFGAATAVASQLAQVRRRVAGLGAAGLGVAYVLRMVGNSADSRGGVRWATPLGWVEELQPFGARNGWALVPLLLTPAVLGAVAVRLRGVRDTGGALVATESAGRPHLRLLTSPVAFSWRSNWQVLTGWVVGLVAVGAVMGALVGTMVDWLAEDEGYQQILANLGMDAAVTTGGFLAMIGVMLGLAVVIQVVWRVGAAWAEEESGRLEGILARPVTRVRWLGGHVLLAALGGLLLTAVLGTSVWLGARSAGASEISLGDALLASANALPVVALVGGVTVATLRARAPPHRHPPHDRCGRLVRPLSPRPGAGVALVGAQPVPVHPPRPRARRGVGGHGRRGHDGAGRRPRGRGAGAVPEARPQPRLRTSSRRPVSLAPRARHGGCRRARRPRGRPARTSEGGQGPVLSDAPLRRGGR